MINTMLLAVLVLALGIMVCILGYELRRCKKKLRDFDLKIDDINLKLINFKSDAAITKDTVKQFEKQIKVPVVHHVEPGAYNTRSLMVDLRQDDEYTIPIAKAVLAITNFLGVELHCTDQGAQKIELIADDLVREEAGLVGCNADEKGS